jgi:cysteine synthase
VLKTLSVVKDKAFPLLLADTVLAVIGNTPLIAIAAPGRNGVRAKVWAKVEQANPGGPSRTASALP